MLQPKTLEIIFSVDMSGTRHDMIVGGMPWPKTGETHYHAQLGLLEQGREFPGLVICRTYGCISNLFDL